MIQGKPGKKAQDPIWKITKAKKSAEDMAQVIEHLTTSMRPWALSPKPSKKKSEDRLTSPEGPTFK
jgi:hypothetical protein